MRNYQSQEEPKETGKLNAMWCLRTEKGNWVKSIEILNKIWILVNDNMKKQKPNPLNAFVHL